MEVLYSCCCGIDVHAETAVACLIKAGNKEVRTFSTTTDDLLNLLDWLTLEGCTQVAIECTGVYWKPVFNILEEHMEVILTNARDAKGFKSRKTDVIDAEWLADLLRHGWLKPPFQAMAQTPAGPISSAALRNLSEFEGVYDYRDGGTLSIVASGPYLVAIIGEGKYLLRAAGVDTFTNSGGDPIPFLRDSDGRIAAFKEGGDTFRRLSLSVPVNTRLLLDPRPKGRDGQMFVYRYKHPMRLPDGIRAGEAGAGTLSTEVAEQLVNGVIGGAYPEVRSILVYHKGALRLEEYFYGYDRDRPHQMRSLTKSVISLLAGAAIDRELLRADEPVFGKLGYAVYENPDPRKARVTLLDLLSNQSGLACNDYDEASPGNEVKLYETPDWAKAFVDLPMMSDPGTVGRYCSGGIIAAGRIIERAAGKPLPDFAQEALFDPLGIQRSCWKWNFRLDHSQRSEFGQIYLRPRDLLKLGILIQQRGEWEARRVVSASWIEEAVAPQSRIDDSDYGLGIWHRWYNVQTSTGDHRIDTIMLSGNGGQKVYLVPTLDLIVVFTGGSFNMKSPVNEMMARVLLPALIEARATVKRPSGRD